MRRLKTLGFVMAAAVAYFGILVTANVNAQSAIVDGEEIATMTDGIDPLGVRSDDPDVALGRGKGKGKGSKPKRFFERIATFPVVRNTCDGSPDAGCVDQETVAEIVAATEDGMTLIYTDSETEQIGFVDITDPYNPLPAGTLPVGGEPTSVAVAGDYALVAVVDASSTFEMPMGSLLVIDIDDRSIEETLDLGGQPDAVAVSPDRKYAAIAIENERDEARCVGGTFDGEIVIEEDEDRGTVSEDDCEDGGGEIGVPPQNPPGFVVVLELDGLPWQWKKTDVDLVGVADKFPADPEPEFVDINRKNIAVVTLQENNHIVLIDLKKAEIKRDFAAGYADVENVDTEDDSLIQFDSHIGVPREADAVAWVSDKEFATADEGDLDGGTRGFTVYDDKGKVEFEAENEVEYETIRVGHYPDDRSDNKGNEPEGAEFGSYRDGDFLFIGSERASVILAYDASDAKKPKLHQTMAAGGPAPEGLLAIPHRDLFVVATEADDRGDKFRATLTVFKYGAEDPDYPTIVSKDRKGGDKTPTPWGALSGLAADRDKKDEVYAVYDSFYRKSRIFRIKAKKQPAEIKEEIVLVAYDDDVMAALDAGGIEIEDDHTVNLDPEGIATREDGGFWIASEGSGSVDDESRPIEKRNLLLAVDEDGEIERVVRLPMATDAKQRRFGFEGVASVGEGDYEVLYVAIQREWVDDPSGFVRIGRYEVATDSWAFAYYQLDPAESPNGGWIGLSEIVAIDDYTLAVVERDNQGNTDARVKRVYAFDVEDVEFRAEGEMFDRLMKDEDIEFVIDLMDALEAANGSVIEKVEGMAVLGNGDLVIVTDNDGVADSSGETQFINLGEVF